MSLRRLFALALPLALAPACRRAPEAAAHEDAAHGEGAEALGPHGQPLVLLEATAQEHLDLGLARASACTHQAAVRAPARVIDDPARRTTLRAPIAGRWIAPPSGLALALGARLEPGADLGVVRPRLSAVERSDAAAKLAQARSETAQAQAALDASSRALARAVELNQADKNASDRAVEEARSRREQDAARLAGAEESARVLEALLAPTADSGAALPLRLARGGELVELLARPGEELDAGAPLLALADFSTLLVRVDVPPSAAAVAPPAELRVASAFDARGSAVARFVGLDPDAARSNGAPAWLCALEAGPDARLRPGAALEAWIPVGDARAGWSVPDAAVVRLGGRAWVYLKSAGGAFERVPIGLDEPLDDARGGGWFTREPWAGESELVARGAQALLSTEIVGAQTSSGAGAEE